jgi:hypothetical protein
MEAMLRNSLYSYFYLKLTKMLCLSYYHLCLLFKVDKRTEQVLPGSQEGRGGRKGQGMGGEMVQTMDARMIKRINNKKINKCNLIN